MVNNVGQNDGRHTLSEAIVNFRCFEPIEDHRRVTLILYWEREREREREREWFYILVYNYTNSGYIYEWSTRNMSVVPIIIITSREPAHCAW